MLHSKRFRDISEALDFINANTVLPISFFPHGPAIMVIYDTVEIPKTTTPDLLTEVKQAMYEIIKDGFIIPKPKEDAFIQLLEKLESC